MAISGNTITELKKTDKKHIEVLLIEDNPDHALLIREMLAEAKEVLFAIKSVDQLSHGLDCLAQKKYDVILTDLSLPDCWGLDTFIKVRNNSPDIPIIVLSVLDDQNIAVEAVQAGAQDYLVKGQIDGHLLGRSIFYAIERRQAKKVLERAHNELEKKVKQRTADLAKINQELQVEINEREQTEKVLQKRNQIQNLFNKMLSISLQPHRLEEILDRILDLIVSIPWLTFQSKGSILLLEDNPGELITKSFREFPPDQQVMCTRVPVGRCLCGLAVSTKEIQFAHSLDDPRHETKYKGINPHGHYCTPILSANNVLGVLNLYVQENHPHSKEEEEFLLSIANALAGIIERKRAEEELAQHRQHLEKLVEERTKQLTKINEQLRREITDRKTAEEKMRQSFKIQNIINLTLQISLEPIPLKEQLKRVLDITLSIPWLKLQSRGAIFLVKDDPETLLMEVNRNLSSKHASGCQKILFGECLCGLAAAKKQILFSTCHQSKHVNHDPHSHYCVPILFENKVLGVMVLYSDVGHERNNEEGETLLAIARALAGIIERNHAEKTIKIRQEEINNLNKNLAERVKKEVEMSRQKDFIMMHQSRLAAMGEMIGNIAHQWKQPLNALIFLLYNIQDSYESKQLTEELLEELIEKGDQLIRKMAATVDDFKSFFKPDKQKEEFCVNKIIKESLSLIDAAFKQNNISVQLHEEGQANVLGFANEYSQVILNVLNNAKDAIIAKGVTGEIQIDVFKEKDFNVLRIKDNGGGIPEKIKNRIFDPYFTTKEEGKGTGIGLYMSKLIIEEHMNGYVEAHNKNGGAEFEIITPLAHSKSSNKKKRQRQTRLKHE
jgi:C4-dicarboxylate-specific signal transduction histidine kinase